MQPAPLINAMQLRIGLLRQRQEILGVPLPQSLSFPARLQLLQRVLADRFEHAKARHAVCARFLPDQSVVEQRFKPIQHTPCVMVVRLAHSLSSLKRPAAHKPAQPAKQHLLALLEQIIAPPDRVA